MKSTLLLLAAAAMSADISLSGKVLDESGAPVEGARVSLDGVTGSVVTGSAGDFLLEGDAGGVSVLPSTRIGARVSLISGTVEWSQAPAGATLEVLKADGRILARGIPFVSGRAKLPEGSGIAPLLRIRHGGAVVANLSGAGTGAYRSAGAGGVMRFSKTGFLSDTLSVASLKASDLSKALVASDPWLPTSLEKSGTMVRIQAAGRTFAMGSNVVWDEFDIPESPRHSVKFTKDFWMDTVEVTQALYDSVMKAGYPEYSGSIDWQAHFGIGPTYPAYGATAGGAILFCNARSRLEGRDSVYSYTARDGVSSHASLTGVVAARDRDGYRLPTEAEWEYAARAGTTSDFPWGGMSLETASISAGMDAHAVWQGNAFDVGDGTPGYGTHPVASLPANAYGLYDMHGNLAEWCWDVIDNSGYQPGQAVDPMTAPNPLSSTKELFDLPKRGGHWANSPNFLRSSSRTFEAKVYFSYNEGFRSVRTGD